MDVSVKHSFFPSWPWQPRYLHDCHGNQSIFMVVMATEVPSLTKVFLAMATKVSPCFPWKPSLGISMVAMAAMDVNMLRKAVLGNRILGKVFLRNAFTG